MAAKLSSEDLNEIRMGKGNSLIEKSEQSCLSSRVDMNLDHLITGDLHFINYTSPLPATSNCKHQQAEQENKYGMEFP